jgi:hypothetical protein
VTMFYLLAWCALWVVNYYWKKHLEVTKYAGTPLEGWDMICTMFCILYSAFGPISLMLILDEVLYDD